MKKILLQIFGGLIAEQKDGLWVISMGKTAFWVLFVHCLYMWAGATNPVTDSELYALFALLGYQGVKLGASTVGAFKTLP